MASPADQLGILPPELRLCVYSHLLFGDGEEGMTICIGQKQFTGDKYLSNDSVSAILALCEDQFYDKWRRGRQSWSRWSGGVDEAFFQGV